MISSNFNINDFLDVLKQNEQQPIQVSNNNAKSIEKVYLSYPGNYGKYQIMPMCSTVSGLPFETLKNTREVKIQREKSDGTTQDVWLRILPSSAYKMNDGTGNLVSSLTTEEETLLKQAQQTFDALYAEIGGREKDDSIRKSVAKHLRRRDYTVFHAKCMNKWNMNDNRNAEKSNFSALFVCTAKGFSQAVMSNIDDVNLQKGNNTEWMNQVYNRQLEKRTGYLLFSIALGQGGKVGYSITVSHVPDAASFCEQYSISEEDAELMKDPIESFLGWQADKAVEGHLFSKKVYQDIINVLTEELTSVRAAKQVGADIFKAMEDTSKKAAAAMTFANTNNTNDPVLKEQQNNNADTPTNPGAVFGNNTQPFQTPPAAQVDPMNPGNMNSGQQSAPYTQPAFANFGNPGFGANQPMTAGNPWGSNN